MGEADARGEGALRIDRWLWCVRLFKTRSLAAEAVAAGHVKLNGQRTKVAHGIKVGDALKVVKGHLELELRVDRIPARRGAAPEAQACYTETAQSVERRRLAAEQRRQPAVAAPTAGRPDKRTRRLLRERQRER